ncbi:MAG: aldehyde dehydrogenase family protein [Hyphomicrobiaceae bacterium]
MNAPDNPGSATVKTFKMLINGEWLLAADGRELPVESPGTRSIIGSIPRGGVEDIDRAARAADAAFPAWRRVAPRDRGQLLQKIADRLEENVEEMSRVLAEESGNAIRTQARGEANSAVDIFRYFGGLASELKGETIPLGEHVLSYTRREPIGVVGAIIPWNAPVALAALKIAPALCAGNTLVLKAAEDAPLGVLLCAKICQEFLPKGVLNVVTGLGEEAGAALSAHPAVRKLSFTGSTEVGKIIMRAAADRIVPISLELGGKSPSIVYADANEDWAVDGIVNAMRFTRQSQSCTAGSRLFLHSDIYDDFLSKLAAKVESLKIGDPLDEETDIGAIINEKQFNKVRGYVEEGISLAGSKMLFGGLPPKEGPLSKGYFALPTVFSHAANDWRMTQEEIFGPVLVAIPWSDEEDVIRMANDTHYGLAGYVWTHDIGRGLRAAHRIEAGWVQVNQGLGQFPGQSYGGIKQSGIGREHSLEGMLDSFTQRKNITVNLEV